MIRILFCLMVVLSPISVVDAKQLHVVFILVDDWGWSDAGVLGSDFYETPNIDRFAESSLRFTRAYSASPVCSPTRAAIMTGKSPARLDMTIWHEGARDGGPRNRKLLPATANPNLPREEITLAEKLKERAYFSAHIGKWHLGTAAYYPETQGFDVNVGGTYWGAPSTFFYPYRGVWSRSDPEMRYVPVGVGRAGDYLTDRLTDHAVSLIDAQRESPFFISLWYHTVHTPIEGKPAVVSRFQQKPAGKNHRHATYAAMVASLDENVGRVLQRLDQRGLTEQTIVVLTSDNGGVDFPSSKSAGEPPTSNHPLRSGKGTLYEGGIRVPLMIRWPGRTRPGTLCSELVTSEDLYPTLVEGLGLGHMPEEIDGMSILKLLEDPDAKLDRNTLYWHYPHYYPRMTPGSAVRCEDLKLIHYYEDDRHELYDLRQDPGEQQDLSEQLPADVRRLRGMLDAWRDDVDANAPRPNRNWNQ